MTIYYIINKRKGASEFEKKKNKHIQMWVFFLPKIKFRKLRTLTQQGKPK